MIENVVELVGCFIKACDCTLVSLLACSDCQWHSRKLYFPYVPTCLEGVSAVWAVKSDMRITSKDWEQNEGCQSSVVFELMKKDKRLHMGQNNVCCSEQAGLVSFDACTQFEVVQKPNQPCFVWLCTVSLICFSTLGCPKNRWCCICVTGEVRICKQHYPACWSSFLISYLWLWNAVLSAFCAVGGVMI